jgi:heat shock protein HtpX
VVSFAGELVYRILFNSWRFGGYGGGGYSGGGRSSGGSDRRSGGGGAAILVVVIAVVLIALSWLLSIVIRMALSRSRETLADAGAVELTRNPDAMISALRKIEGRGELPGATSAVMEMCVDNPREEFADLFATHPSVDSRVAALVKFAGGHDPGKLALPSPDDRPLDSDHGPGQDPGQTPNPPPGPWGAPPPGPGHPPGPWDSPDGSGSSGGKAGPLPNPLPGPWGLPPKN